MIIKNIKGYKIKINDELINDIELIDIYLLEDILKNDEYIEYMIIEDVAEKLARNVADNNIDCNNEEIYLKLLNNSFEESMKILEKIKVYK